MHTRSTRLAIRLMLLTSTVFVAAAAAPIAQNAQQHPTAPGAHHHPEAATIQNPVPSSAASIAAGKKLFDKHCSECHGDTGKGDGMMGDELDPKPANLTDAEWKHGSTDGEIFVVIRDGVKGTGMKAFAKKMTAHQMWDVVNFVRSIGPAKSH
jgi:mono/diheme cytochrome c family protein